MKKRLLTGCLCLFFGGLLSGQSVIEEAEYYFGADPGPGNGTAIAVPEPNESPVNFGFDIPAETIAALGDGWHTLTIRMKDDDGEWGVAATRRILVGEDTARPPSSDIVAAEYFFDTDPGVGNGKPITIETPAPLINISFDIPAEDIDALDPGFHKLVIRAQDEEGHWGVAATRQLNRIEPLSEEQTNAKVARIDYQWFVEGEEVGEEKSLTPEEPAPIIEFAELLDLTDLDGVTAVLRMTPFDTAGDMGHPAFQTIAIEWLDEEDGGQGDGLPDAWEDQFEGLDSTVVDDKDGDIDFDGLTNFEEFLAQTDPGNPDTDGDGISDFSEVIMVDYGFDPNEDNSDLLDSLHLAAVGAGLYSTEVQLRDLNMDVPIIGRDPLTGKIFIRLRIEQSSTLDANDWAQVPLGSEDVSTTGGDIRVLFPDLDSDLYFIRVFTDDEFE